jgi:hypothetical protein
MDILRMKKESQTWKNIDAAKLKKHQKKADDIWKRKEGEGVV